MSNDNLAQSELFDTIAKGIEAGRSTIIHIQDEETNLPDYSYTVGGTALGGTDYICLGGLPFEAFEALLPVCDELYQNNGAGTYIDIFGEFSNVNVVLHEIPADLAAMSERYMTQTYSFYDQTCPEVFDNMKVVVQICWMTPENNLGDYEIIGAKVDEQVK